MAAETSPTHAGGVVVRDANGVLEFLLVRPSNGRDEWVLPKGHVDPGERPPETAVREIREEAGVEASIIASLGQTEQPARDGTALVEWYLMRFVRAMPAEEQRETGWFRLDDAMARASFADSRRLLRDAADRANRGFQGHW